MFSKIRGTFCEVPIVRNQCIELYIGFPFLRETTNGGLGLAVVNPPSFVLCRDSSLALAIMNESP